MTRIGYTSSHLCDAATLCLLWPSACCNSRLLHGFGQVQHVTCNVPASLNIVQLRDTCTSAVIW